METIKRYLIRVKIYASDKNGESTLIDTQEVETDSGTLVLMPNLKLFADGVNLSATLEFVEARDYKNSTSNAGMIERVE
jgi:hypothetical protein